VPVSRTHHHVDGVCGVEVRDCVGGGVREAEVGEGGPVRGGARVGDGVVIKLIKEGKRKYNKSLRAENRGWRAIKAINVDELLFDLECIYI
jgi:hypothetical protein